MKKLSLLLYLSFLFYQGCSTKGKETPLQALQEVPGCNKGTMEEAHYLVGEDEPIPKHDGLEEDFLILVDSNSKATNFISSYESYCRERSATLDTTDINWQEGWEKLTSKKKLAEAKQSRSYYKHLADSIHAVNNQGLNQIWVINNSLDTVSVQMQDGSFICVLQAVTKAGEWRPIEYWNFSWCGNSYYHKDFLPKTANSFITNLPKKGNYTTRLRFKLLGKNTFFYSNEFNGKIDYCDFVEDSTNYRIRSVGSEPHYKLDSMVHLSVF